MVSYSLEISSIIVDFPEPVFPKIAKVSPEFTVKLMFFKAVIFVSSYLKVTFLKVTLPLISVDAELLF